MIMINDTMYILSIFLLYQKKKQIKGLRLLYKLITIAMAFCLISSQDIFDIFSRQDRRSFH